MEVVPAAADVLARSNVQEWSRLDELTGVVEQGRRQADHWASPNRQYGKVVDSRRLASASGGLQQRRHQQLEVFSERGPGGSRLQVVRSSTVSSSSSTSAWRKAPAGFDNLQLSLNPLDSSPQKTRASVGRSGSIGGRRPPSRPRSLVGKLEAAAISEEDLEIEVATPRIQPASADSSEDEEERTATPLSRQKSSSTENIHQEAHGDSATGEDWRREAKFRRSLQFPAAKSGTDLPPLRTGMALKSIEALESIFRRGANIADSVNRTLADGKGCGELDVNSLANHLKNEQQKTSSEEEGSSYKNKINTKRHSFVTEEKLKEVRGRLRRLSSPISDDVHSENTTGTSEDRDDGIGAEDADRRDEASERIGTSRVKSFVFDMETAAARKSIPSTGSLESRTSNRSSSSAGSRSEEWYNRRKSYGFEQMHEQDRDSKQLDRNKIESSTDSGICRSSEVVAQWNRTAGSTSKIDDKGQHGGQTSVIPVRTTRSLQVNKSIPVDDHLHGKLNGYADENNAQQGRKTVVTLGTRFQRWNEDLGHRMLKESALQKRNDEGEKDEKTTFNIRRFSEPVTITIPITCEDSESKRDQVGIVEENKQLFRQLRQRPNSIAEGSKPFIVNIKRKEDNVPTTDSLFSSSSSALRTNPWGKNEGLMGSKQEDSEMKRHSIAVDDARYVNEDIKRSAGKHALEPTISRISTSELAKKFDSLSINKKETNQTLVQNEVKQFSSGINVSFVQNGFVKTEEEDEESTLINGNFRKQKKVEFCKTEVHFVADSGRVNIVETDEKPPPTNMFRRRKRTGVVTSPPADPTKPNLPQLRFGDSLYEKKLLGGNEETVSDIEIPSEHTIPTELHNTELSPPRVSNTFQDDADKEDHIYTQANATISPLIGFEDSGTMKCDTENTDTFLSNFPLDRDNMPRSILKNYRKPRPFHLGENGVLASTADDEVSKQENKWGVRLRPAIWRSQVVVRSKAFESPQDQPSPAPFSKPDTDSDSELQRQLRSLRPAHQRKPEEQPDDSERDSPFPSRRYSRETEDKGVQVKVTQQSWSVADRIRHVEEMKRAQSEARGFSTRVNFGSGEATVVGTRSEDEPTKPQPGYQHADTRKPQWPIKTHTLDSADEKDERSANRGLIVRFSKMEAVGKDAPAAERRVHEDTKTTITIDLGSASETKPKKPERSRRKQQQQQPAEVLESPWLIMRTMQGSVRNQLAVLKRLYSEDSESDGADEEVRSYMEDDGELSGSWSRLRASRLHSGLSKVTKQEEVQQMSTVQQKSLESNRLRAVETFVSTRSGQPKITSISLHYEGDQNSTDTRRAADQRQDKISHSKRYDGSKQINPPEPTIIPFNYSPPTKTRNKTKETYNSEKESENVNYSGNEEEIKSLYHESRVKQSTETNLFATPEREKLLVPPGERCYGDGESGSMTRKTRTSSVHEHDVAYAQERKQFEIQKEKYLRNEAAEVSQSNRYTGIQNDGKYHNQDAESRTRKKMVKENFYESENKTISPSPEKIYVKESLSLKSHTERLKSSREGNPNQENVSKRMGNTDRELPAKSWDDSHGDGGTKLRMYENQEELVAGSRKYKERMLSASSVKEIRSKESEKRIASKSNNIPKALSSSHSKKFGPADRKNQPKSNAPKVEKGTANLPIYENCPVISRDDKRENETTILEELTRAADQILQAVNGYSDEASSVDDDERGRGIRRGTKLCTISESPHQRKAETGVSGKKPQRAAKLRLGPTSSTSSVDSFTRDERPAAAANRRSAARNARLLQRASSREQLLHARASSSEDAPSSLEPEDRRPKPTRKVRVTNTGTRLQPAKRQETGDSDKTTDRVPGKKNLSPQKIRDAARERSNRLVSSRRVTNEIKHRTNRALTDKVSGNSHSLLPSSSRDKNERCISERRTVVAVMPLRPSAPSTVRKTKQSSSRSAETTVKSVKS